MRHLNWIAFMALLLFLLSPVDAQRDISVHAGKPWERIEQQRDDIENTILSGNLGGGFVLSASHLYEWKDTPAFLDIATSVQRAYGGLPLTQEEHLLEFLKSELVAKPFGIGWLECGLLALAAMKVNEAVPAFQNALRDPLCRQVPLTHALLAQAHYHMGDIGAATQSFRAAIKAASKEQAVQFQMRYLYADAMQGSGHFEEWQKAVEDCCNSTYPLECAWGLEQEAEYAWYRKDMKSFETFVDLALAQISVYGESPEWKWRWDKDRWDWVTRHLGYAKAALAGASDGQMILDYGASILEGDLGNLEGAKAMIAPWLSLYKLEDIDTWTAERQLFVQRAYIAYYILQARTGQVEEAVQGFESMIPLARDTYHDKFKVSLYCHLGYALLQGQRHEDARKAYEIGLSLLDVPGEIIDPSIAYHPRGLIGKNSRVGFVANYRNLINYLKEMGEDQ